MNWLAHSIDACTRSAAPRKTRPGTDWRAVIGVGFLVIAALFAFGRGMA